MAIFQKSAAKPARNGAPSAASSDSRTDTKANEHARLHVGRDLRLHGSVENCEILVIEGYMKASSVHSKKVTVAETGVLEGEVSADNIEVHGRFKGTLLARLFLDVRAGGEVDGEIAYGDLAVAQGGRLSGNIKRADGLTQSAAPAGAPIAAAPTKGAFVPRAS